MFIGIKYAIELPGGRGESLLGAAVTGKRVIVIGKKRYVINDE